MDARPDTQTRPGTHELVATRVIDAPPSVVFEVWTKPEHLTQWWGPTGFTLPSCDIDFREGGAFRYCMHAPDGIDHWLRGVFHEIVPNERIVFTFVWEEAEGTFSPETLVKVTFEAQEDKTRVVLHHSGFGSEIAARGHEGGWSEQLDRLVVYASALSRNA